MITMTDIWPGTSGDCPKRHYLKVLPVFIKFDIRHQSEEPRKGGGDIDLTPEENSLTDSKCTLNRRGKIIKENVAQSHYVLLPVSQALQIIAIHHGKGASSTAIATQPLIATQLLHSCG